MHPYSSPGLKYRVPTARKAEKQVNLRLQILAVPADGFGHGPIAGEVLQNSHAGFGHRACTSFARGRFCVAGGARWRSKNRRFKGSPLNINGGQGSLRVPLQRFVDATNYIRPFTAYFLTKQ